MASARLCECLESFVKGKRIWYRPQSSHRDPARGLRQRLGFEHGFPLMRSLRASAQRSTSALFSFRAFPVDCAQIICLPAIKNDSGAIL
jgi:hypothetical protein